MKAFSMRKHKKKEITSLPTVSQLEAELNEVNTGTGFIRCCSNTIGTLIAVAAAAF